MDYIEGDYVESLCPEVDENPLIGSLVYIYSLLKKEEFDIGDRLEAIYNQEKKCYIIVDLGGLVHQSSYF
jgi:hypothetical protein